jgi:hypothetical protein
MPFAASAAALSSLDSTTSGLSGKPYDHRSKWRPLTTISSILFPLIAVAAMALCVVQQQRHSLLQQQMHSLEQSLQSLLHKSSTTSTSIIELEPLVRKLIDQVKSHSLCRLHFDQIKNQLKHALIAVRKSRVLGKQMNASYSALFVADFALRRNCRSFRLILAPLSSSICLSFTNTNTQRTGAAHAHSSLFLIRR